MLPQQMNGLKKKKRSTHAQQTVQSPIQKNKMMLFTGKWMELEIIVQDKPVSGRQV